mmetsp:Transcript_54258/g.85970  ORF Transcript_54258/g.85970 Transcript_54258/m.85970 type:complete len:114 (+) Transcript_54258:617-958(+)
MAALVFIEALPLLDELAAPLTDVVVKAELVLNEVAVVSIAVIAALVFIKALPLLVELAVPLADVVVIPALVVTEVLPSGVMMGPIPLTDVVVEGLMVVLASHSRIGQSGLHFM